jgi:flagellar secretion chaperone FliS
MKIIRNHDLETLVEAEPARRVVMLYDEAIAALRVASMASTAGDIEGRCNAVTAAMEIVGYLYMTLDPELGGEIAANLGALYAHVLAQLPRVNLRNDADAAEHVIAILEPLRDSWNELANTVSVGGEFPSPGDPAEAQSAA